MKIVRGYLEFILRMIAKFDRFKKSKSTRTNHDEELGSTTRHRSGSN